MQKAKPVLSAGRPSAARAMSVEDTEALTRINAQITESQKRKLKIYSAQTGKSFTDIIRAWIDALPE